MSGKFGTGAEVSYGHFGTSAEVSDTSAPVPKCLGSKVSWVRSVLTPFERLSILHDLVQMTLITQVMRCDITRSPSWHLVGRRRRRRRSI